jgi:pimeloyl-ACP methyl ester carboxylesterase
MIPPRHVLQLASGGSAGLVEFGVPDGHPALYLHGTPSSAVEAFWLRDACTRHGIRLLSIDRPGYGESSVVEPGLDVAGRWICGVADGLGLDRFGVIAFSGGAGSALGAAAAGGARVTTVQLGGGMGSIAGLTRQELPTRLRLQLTAVAKSDLLFRVLFGRMSRARQKQMTPSLRIPTLAALEMLAGSSAGPQLAAAEAFARGTSPDDLRDFCAAYIAAASHLHGVRADLLGISRPWPFDLGTVTAPVELWHGTADQAAPIATARKLAGALPTASLHELRDEGHFVLLTHADEICASVASSRPGLAA